MAAPAAPNASPEFPQLDNPAAHEDLVVVCARITVTAYGDTKDFTPLFDTEDCPSSSDRPPEAFTSAAEEAMSRWKFFAAAECVMPSGETFDDPCEHPEVRLNPVSIYLVYRFEFVRGQPQGSPRKIGGTR